MGRLCWFENGGCDDKFFFKVESWHTTVMNKPWRTFCRPDINFIEHYESRGTSLIGAASLSPVTKLVGDTGAVSWYKLSRSQKFIPV